MLVVVLAVVVLVKAPKQRLQSRTCLFEGALVKQLKHWRWLL
jgi:hypothetical protein